jgi:hypothetical protein
VIDTEAAEEFIPFAKEKLQWTLIDITSQHYQQQTQKEHSRIFLKRATEDHTIAFFTKQIGAVSLFGPSALIEFIRKKSIQVASQLTNIPKSTLEELWAQALDNIHKSIEKRQKTNQEQTSNDTNQLSNNIKIQVDQTSKISTNDN